MDASSVGAGISCGNVLLSFFLCQQYSYWTKKAVAKDVLGSLVPSALVDIEDLQICVNFWKEWKRVYVAPQTVPHLLYLFLALSGSSIFLVF